jgi:hypothetical protein
MSLNLLPADKIEKRFKAIEIEVGGMRENCLLRKFCDYVDRTWMTSTVWPPRSWSMYMQHRRTNNNAEGKKYSVGIRNKS